MIQAPLYNQLAVSSPDIFTAQLSCFSCLLHKVTAVPHHARVLCSGAITNLTKLYVERLLDNLIPPGDLVRPLSLLIFTLSLIQAPSLFLCLHNVGFLSFLFYVPLYRFSLPSFHPQALRQHAAYANHWPFILNTRPPTSMRPQENTHARTHI